MSRLTDFYRQAQENKALMADLQAANEKYNDRTDLEEWTTIDEVINIAANHGITLSRADFEQELDQESDLMPRSYKRQAEFSGSSVGSSSSWRNRR